MVGAVGDRLFQSVVKRLLGCVGAVLQEELTYKRYSDWQDVARLVTYCFLEHFPYRQLHMVWRLQGLWQYMRGDMAWKALERKGLSATTTAP
jgi:hypothetical protein